ncbi:MAG: Raf kinase inhibitor-like YbhB/YbcL family protein [Myxococcota bacterium]|jgi:Raf kinase inhibitor-like YbhB/YbcL family protein
MHVRSDSFRPYDTLDTRLCFAKHDPASHVTLAGNRNPHLAWSDVPEGTRSFALICVDPEVPSRGDDVNQEERTVPVDLPRVDFHHWVIADLPSTLREILEGSHCDGVIARGKPAGASPSGGVQGLNDYTGWFAGDPDMAGDYCGYDGPCPPWNDERVHAYRFQLYALDVATVGLSGPFTAAALREAMAGHVLATAEIVGIYHINPEARPRR